jgi:hypothetical protein
MAKRIFPSPSWDEAIALAVTEHLTIGTNALLHPRTIAVFLEAVVPYIHKIIFVILPCT